MFIWIFNYGFFQENYWVYESKIYKWSGFYGDVFDDFFFYSFM